MAGAGRDSMDDRERVFFHHNAAIYWRSDATDCSHIKDANWT